VCVVENVDAFVAGLKRKKGPAERGRRLGELLEKKPRGIQQKSVAWTLTRKKTLHAKTGLGAQAGGKKPRVLV